MKKPQPKLSEVVTPKPFFKIKFECSNNAFYIVKSDLYEIAACAGIEIQDGYITEKCDFEGDLEEIVIYNCERGETLIQGVVKFWGITTKIPDDMNVVLSIF